MKSVSKSVVYEWSVIFVSYDPGYYRRMRKENIVVLVQWTFIHKVWLIGNPRKLYWREVLALINKNVCITGIRQQRKCNTPEIDPLRQEY